MTNLVTFFFFNFQETRGDREIDNIFTAFQNTIETKDSSLEKCRLVSETNLPVLKVGLENTLNICEKIIEREPDSSLFENLDKNRESRKEIWKQFVDDMVHKCSRVDFTFQEKEEELREFYTDLEQKLHIHK